MKDQIERWDRLSVHEPDAAVIDPLDTRGCKNQYICCLRNQAIVTALRQGVENADAPILDFGCGTGSLSKALVGSGRQVVGVDISMGLLKRTAERGLGSDALFVRYDGYHLPLADGSVDAAVTWVVLNYILDDDELERVLADIYRVLRPGGRIVAIEQVRSKRTVDLVAWQCRRTSSEFSALFERAGFAKVSAAIVRYGRLPTTYAVRLGWIPERLFAPLHRLERWMGRRIGVLPWDYCEVLFVMEK